MGGNKSVGVLFAMPIINSPSISSLMLLPGAVVRALRGPHFGVSQAKMCIMWKIVRAMRCSQRAAIV